MGLRICITGTESTGKTTLAEQLAGKYNAVLVPDYSRQYIANLTREYNYEDVLNIARGIIEQEDALLKTASKILFTDNDLINIKIWLQYYLWEIPDWLTQAITERKNDLYLLCFIDLPWVADVQRANPHDRDKLFAEFEAELSLIGADYTIIQGNYQNRIEMSVNQVDKFMKKFQF